MYNNHIPQQTQSLSSIE